MAAAAAIAAMAGGGVARAEEAAKAAPPAGIAGGAAASGAAAGGAAAGAAAAAGGAAASGAAAAAPWSIEISEGPELAVGAAGALRVTLRGHGRHAIARSGLRLDVAAPRGLALRQRRYQRGDAVEADAADPSFSIPVRAEAAGAHALELRLRFWSCNPRSCRPADERRTISIVVREPPPPAPAPPPPAAAPVGGPAAPRLPAPKPPVRRVPASRP